MKTRAAILRARNTPWSVEEIELDPPKAGEVLVKLAASGMCHSDEHVMTGDLAGVSPNPPMIAPHQRFSWVSVSARTMLNLPASPGPCAGRRR